MEFNLTKFLPSNWLHAFGATLFHSLWLGILLSLLVAVIMFSTRKAAASLRYNLLTGSLLLFVVATTFVFYKSLEFQDTASATNVIMTDANKPTQISPSVAVLQNNMLSGVNSLLNVWNTYAAQIVLIWFLIICAKSIQLFVGLNGVYHLRSTKVYAAGNKWDKKISQFAKHMGVKQSVGLLQSGIAQVPMALGYFKPLVLIPLGLLNNLSDTEVEAILCHELAHIKRRDYLINLFQSFIEIVFFFNPAVLWVSKLIRNERENCCDDLAVLHMDNKKDYVKALITCQEFQLNAPRFAMAVTGKKNHLFQRISRMLFDTKTTLNKMEKTILTIALVSVVICSAAFKNVTESNNVSSVYNQDFQEPFNKKRTKAEVEKHTAEMVKAKREKSKRATNADKKASETNTLSMEQEINLRQEQEANAIKAEIDAKAEEQRYKLEQKKYEAAEKRRKVDELKYDAEEKLGLEKYNAAEKRRKADELRYNAEQKKYNTEQIRYDLQAKKYQAESDRYEAEAKRYNANKNLHYNANRNLNYNAVPLTPSIPPTPNVPLSPMSVTISTPISPAIPIASGNSEPLAPLNENLSSNQTIASTTKTKNQSNSKTTSKTGTQRTVESVTSTDADVHDYKNIIKDMISDGIIKSDKKLSYKLDKNSLIINNARQNESYHQKYKKKYLQRENTALLYKYETNSN